MYGKALEAMQRVALSRLVPSQAATTGTQWIRAPRFPKLTVRRAGAGASREWWPWPPASPLMPGLLLFPFGKGLLLHCHHWEKLPQQLPALLPDRGAAGKRTLGGKGWVVMRPQHGEQPCAPRHSQACASTGDNVSCLFTGWSRPGWLQCLAPCGLMLQCWECPRGYWPYMVPCGKSAG